MIGTAFHVCLYALAIVGLLSLGVQGYRVHQHRSHDAIMARIAVRESQLGHGIIWSREWVDAQPKRTRKEHLMMSGEWWCYACGEWHEANGSGFHKMCRHGKRVVI